MKVQRVSVVAVLVGVALLGTACRPSQPGASGAAKVTVMTAVPQGSPSDAMYWLGKGLGFDNQQHVDIDVLTVPNGNTAQSVQLVASGQIDAALTSIESIVVPASQGKDTGLIFVYNLYQRPQWRFLLAKGSGITSIAQLRGKAVGIPISGNPAEPILKAFLTEGGLTMADVTVRSVGSDAPAAQALKSGQVAALLTVSLSSALWEAAGYEFVTLPEPKEFDDLIGPAIAVARTALRDPVKRDAIVRFLRTWAMSSVFARTNPEAAIRIDYQLFPTARPRGVSDAAALLQGMRAQASVIDSYTTNVGGRWGAFGADAFQKYLDFLGIQVPDSQALWTNELIDDVNQFDAASIEQMAHDAH